MNAIKAVLSKLGHFFLAIFRSLRKILCCRRRKEPEHLLPMTIKSIVNLEGNLSSYETSQWDVWPEPDYTHAPASNIRSVPDIIPQDIPVENENDDFFKDMVPQIRKTKKVYVRNEHCIDQERAPSNRLAMDPKAIAMEPDLGIIDDSPSNWEDVDNIDESWDPDILIREKKRAEQEKRRAEHQRRKQEKENKKNIKPESLSSMMMSLTDSKDKHKCS